MENFDPDVLLFHACRDLDGTICHLDLGKRNGRVVPLNPPSSRLESSDDRLSPRAVYQLIKDIYSNLTKVEQRTWKALLDGKPILDIAREEGVSRNAVYERIRGNSEGQGGMIRKNAYVAVWWLLRRKEEL